jgi:hypothetical protein
MNSQRSLLAMTTALLLTAATVTAASAQTQERNSTRMNAGTSGQLNAQGLGMNAGTKVQGRANVRSNVQGPTRTSSTMMRNNSGATYGNRDRDRGRERFASSRDRYRGDRFAGRFSDRDRFAGRFTDRDRFAGRFRDRDQFVNAGWNTGWNTGWGGGWNGGWGGWGWGGPGIGVSVGTGGWGWPGLYSYSPGFVGVGYGSPGCTCGGPGWGWR